jgi:hypothetical protein
MCGHGFMYQTRYNLERHRPTWCCSTCGRVSYAPLDCCTRPDFERQAASAAFVRWLGEMQQSMRTRLWALLRWRPQAARPAMVEVDGARPAGEVPVAVVVNAEDGADATVVTDEPVGAGERV